MLLQVVELLQDCGAAAISIHGRTMEQRYKRAADWDLISSAARASTTPIIGNGDILTLFEVSHPSSRTIGLRGFIGYKVWMMCMCLCARARVCRL